jgi:hypothetical protein
VSAVQVLLELTSASAETWKSEYTTRPHCLSAATSVGMLNVMLSSMSGVFVVLSLEKPVTQDCDGGFRALMAS